MQQATQAVQATAHYTLSKVHMALKFLHSAFVPTAARHTAAADDADAAAVQACAKFAPPPYSTQSLPHALKVRCFMRLRPSKWTAQLAPPPNTCYSIHCVASSAATIKSTCALELRRHELQHLELKAAAQRTANAPRDGTCHFGTCNFCHVRHDANTSSSGVLEFQAHHQFLAVMASTLKIRASYDTRVAKLQVARASATATLVVMLPASVLVLLLPGECLHLLLAFVLVTTCEPQSC
jgi:hypothetical protein